MACATEGRELEAKVPLTCCYKQACWFGKARQCRRKTRLKPCRVLKGCKSLSTQQPILAGEMTRPFMCGLACRYLKRDNATDATWNTVGFGGKQSWETSKMYLQYSHSRNRAGKWSVKTGSTLRNIAFTHDNWCQLGSLDASLLLFQPWFDVWNNKMLFPILKPLTPVTPLWNKSPFTRCPHLWRPWNRPTSLLMPSNLLKSSYNVFAALKNCIFKQRAIDTKRETYKKPYKKLAKSPWPAFSVTLQVQSWGRSKTLQIVL